MPGGGAASAIAGALGGSLISMVANLSEGRPKYAPYEETVRRAQSSGFRLTRELLELADRDADAYAAYVEALKLPHETEPEKATRREAMQAAARIAAEVPMACVIACAQVADAAEALAGRSNLNAASDVAVAALLAEAGAKGAAENVRINLPATGDDEYAEETAARLDALVRDIEKAAAVAKSMALAGGLREPEAM